MRRERKTRLSQSDLRAAGVTPQIVRRRIRHSPGPDHDGHQGKKEQGEEAAKKFSEDVDTADQQPIESEADGNTIC